MGQKVTLGGDRLGSGKKDKVELRTYERSTHDLSEVFRSSMAAGTLVPFLVKPMTPTDKWDIGLTAKVFTKPTVGPLFGTAKLQLDLFRVPVRLYNGLMHMNKTELGLNISDVKLPQVHIVQDIQAESEQLEKYQISPSSILSYTGIKGIGSTYGGAAYTAARDFNGIPLLMYWDIYKNYYSNKQEEIGAVINTNNSDAIEDIGLVFMHGTTLISVPNITDYTTPQAVTIEPGDYISLTVNNAYEIDFNKFRIYISGVDGITTMSWKPWNIDDVQWGNNGFLATIYTNITQNQLNYSIAYFKEELQLNNIEPNIVTFPLSNIDDMRMDILSKIKETSAFQINETTQSPYNVALTTLETNQGVIRTSRFGQQGLGLKTYQSDIFNNWLNTEWLDGDSGINNITAIQVENGEFTLDALLLARKVYDMLNNIAVSGGSYYDWMQANWGHSALRQVESPVYEGGMAAEIIFQEVVSNSAALDEQTQQPLGTLAGRGVIGEGRKGGKAIVEADEISYLMGIVSITPRIDYSQGNNWDMNLKTLDDFHKPALDRIGFQDLLTDQMAWWDTRISADGTINYRTAGKQPSWLNYQTSYNKNFGTFAIEEEEMFMVFDRRYETEHVPDEGIKIKDLTTYIDPKKFNYIFAQTRRDAQNYWVQIGVDITARRQMSAKTMPNL